MKANPGGQVDPKEVVGRDALIEEIWETLSGTSILLVAERRIGKTTVLKKMVAQKHDGFLVMPYQDLEHVHTAEDFAQAVFEKAEEYLSARSKTMHGIERLLAKFGQVKIGPVEIKQVATQNWAALLKSTLDDLQQAAEKTVFFWDEFPQMIENIRNSVGGGKTAMTILETLRQCRSEREGLRMVLTGSIGFHHVVNALANEGHRAQPTINDLTLIGVDPLTKLHSVELAKRLIEGEKLEAEDVDVICGEIASTVGGHPFYIQYLAKKLRGYGRLTTGSVEKVVSASLLDPNLNLYHYEERIQPYYGDDAPLVRILLNELAAVEGGLPLKILLERLMSHEAVDKQKFQKLVRLLEQDNYVTRIEGGGVRFRHEFVRRWWVVKQL